MTLTCPGLWSLNQALAPLPCSEGIQLWLSSLQQPVQSMRQLYLTLAPSERRRAQRYRFSQDRRSYIACRGILKSLLARYADLPADEIRFCYGAHGKPALQHDGTGHSIHFSVSHSNQVALFGISRNRELGVDIEYRRPVAEMDAIAGEMLDQADFARYIRLSADAKCEFFFDCWARREALLKAAGIGFSSPASRLGSITKPRSSFCSLPWAPLCPMRRPRLDGGLERSIGTLGSPSPLLFKPITQPLNAGDRTNALRFLPKNPLPSQIVRGDGSQAAGQIGS